LEKFRGKTLIFDDNIQIDDNSHISDNNGNLTAEEFCGGPGGS